MSNYNPDENYSVTLIVNRLSHDMLYRLFSSCMLADWDGLMVMFKVAVGVVFLWSFWKETMTYFYILPFILVGTVASLV